MIRFRLIYVPARWTARETEYTYYQFYETRRDSEETDGFVIDDIILEGEIYYN